MLYAIVGVLGLLLVGAIWLYNRLVALRQFIRNAWSDIEVQLRRRADLIPQLVESVKGYMGYESAVLQGIAEARSLAMQAKGPSGDKANAESRVGEGLAKIVALAESYPELKSSANFIQLQRELAETERLIASARQYYNGCIRDFNTAVESFPSNLVAGAMGLRTQPFFEIETAEQRLAPSVGGLSA